MDGINEFNFEEKKSEWAYENLTFWERNFVYSDDELTEIFLEYLWNKGESND